MRLEKKFKIIRIKADIIYNHFVFLFNFISKKLNINIDKNIGTKVIAVKPILADQYAEKTS